jgi:hypothetical protein
MTYAMFSRKVNGLILRPETEISPVTAMFPAAAAVMRGGGQLKASLVTEHFRQRSYTV